MVENLAKPVAKKQPQPSVVFNMLYDMNCHQGAHSGQHPPLIYSITRKPRSPYVSTLTILAVFMSLVSFTYGQVQKNKYWFLKTRETSSVLTTLVTKDINTLNRITFGTNGERFFSILQEKKKECRSFIFCFILCFRIHKVKHGMIISPGNTFYNFSSWAFHSVIRFEFWHNANRNWNWISAKRQYISPDVLRI